MNDTTQDKQAEPEAGADNNRRLAWFETREAALAEELVARELVTAELAAEDGFDPVAVLVASRDALKTELLEVITDRDKAQAALAKAVAAGQAAKRAAPRGQGRAAKVLKDNPGTEDLLKAIAAAGTIEVVASDGKRELVEIAPLEVKPHHFRRVSRGLALAVPDFAVHAPQPGQPALSLAAWALFIDGKLAACRARKGTMTLGGGARHNLASDVLF